MKAYSISRWAFLGICFLILILPVSRHWKLLISGERTRGTVTAFTLRISEKRMDERDLVQASEIEFKVAGITYKTYGPDDYEYKTGRSVTIFYKRDEPEVNCVATFTGFYLNNYMVLVIVLLIIWYAFYLSFNNYRKKLKKPKGKSGTHEIQVRS
jgi:hypothetical protein